MPRNRIIMFHTLHAQLFEIELLNMGRKHSGTGVIPAQAAVLRDIEIGAELKPHIPEIHTGFDSLISCHPQGGEGVGVGDPLPPGFTEFILDQLPELR